MHYLNGRECKVGDTVIGRTHNSKGLLRIGVIRELMPKQGPCNVKLVLLNSHNVTISCGRMDAKSIISVDGQPIVIATGIDYADCKELYHVEDCVRMLDAVTKFGKHDTSYIMAGGRLDSPQPEPRDD